MHAMKGQTTNFLPETAFWTATASAFPAACRSKAEIPSQRGCGISKRIKKLTEFLTVEDSLQQAAGNLQIDFLA